MMKLYSFFRNFRKELWGMILMIGMIPAAHAQEVIVNGDAETTPVLAVGSWVRQGDNLGDNTSVPGGGDWYLPSSNPYYPIGAMHGGFFFSAGDQLIADGNPILFQQQNVSALTTANGSFTFTAYMATHGNTAIASDIAEIHIKYLDAAFTNIPSLQWDTTFQPTAANDSIWHAVSHSANFLATDGITYVQVVLDGISQSTIEPIHVFFDFVSLSAGPVLPINLLDFRARQTPEHTVDLNWETSMEQNSSYTEIQRGFTGKDFVTIGRVKAAGNSSLTRGYSFVDATPLPGNAFYRLRFVDLDGSFKYSKVLVVNSPASTQAVQIFSNPFHDHISVRVGTPGNDQLNITLTDLQGRIYTRRVYSTQAGNNFIDLYPSGNMAGGIYLLNVRGATVNRTIKMLKY